MKIVLEETIVKNIIADWVDNVMFNGDFVAERRKKDFIFTAGGSGEDLCTITIGDSNTEEEE